MNQDLYLLMYKRYINGIISKQEWFEYINTQMEILLEENVDTLKKIKEN